MAVAPFTPLPDSAEAYRATLPSQFRRNLRVSAKRLAAEGVTHQTIRGRAVLQRLDTLRELHQSQWGRRSGFLPAFDRFAAGFAGGCAADEVVVHKLGNCLTPLHPVARSTARGPDHILRRPQCPFKGGRAQITSVMSGLAWM
jgi:hypothetical protein